MHFRRSHLSEAKFRVNIRSFALDLPASKIADLSKILRIKESRNNYGIW